MTRKYKHLTSGKNYNNVTVSVKEEIAPEISAALDHLIEVTGWSKSKVVCDAILALAHAHGFVLENERG